MKSHHSILFALGALAALVLGGFLHGTYILAQDPLSKDPIPQSNIPTAEVAPAKCQADLFTMAPEEYVHIHAMAMRPDVTEIPVDLGLATQKVRPAWVSQYPHWTNAMARLAEMGDAYSLKLLGSVQTTNASKMVIISNTIQRIEARLKQPSPWPVADVVRARLERAAYADVTCSALEGNLVPWALETTKSLRDQPEVKELLKRIQQEKLPKKDTNNVWQSIMAERVRSYAERLGTAQ